MQSSLLRAERRVDAQNSARSNFVERKLRRYRPELQHKVRALAGRHSRLADLALSFPALLVALSVPRAGFNPEFAISQVIRGVPLADLARTAQIPLWLRKFAPDAFVRAIPKLPLENDFSRRIVNHLPCSSKVAPVWIEAVANTVEWGHEPLAIWIARHLARDPKSVDLERLRLICVWAWFSGRPETQAHRTIKRPWTPSTQFGTAIQDAHKWRAAVGLYVNLGDEVIADVWMQPQTVGGYDFVPLRTFTDIAEEADIMRNCLYLYGDTLVHNCSRLWSVRKDGERIATLEIGCNGDQPLPNVYELKSVGNKAAPVEVWRAARRWLQMHDLMQLNTDRLAWDSVPLHRTVWTKLWKPYWLAKRRIPKWLPLMPSRSILEAL